MSHKTNEIVVAEMVRLLVNAYTIKRVESNTSARELDRNNTLQEGQDFEWRHSKSRRRYNANLQVEDGYHTAKRKAQQEAGYEPEEVQEFEAVNQQSESDYLERMAEDCKDKYVLFQQLYFLADTRWEEGDDVPLEEPKERVAQLKRLLNLDHQRLGQKAVSLIIHCLAHWKEASDRDGNSQRRNRSSEPQLVKLGGKTFAEHMEEKGLIKIPKRCKIGKQDTLPAATMNFYNNYPAEEDQNLLHFAKMFGFENVEDFDEDGKTFMFHLFHAVSYCVLAARIHRAMSHKVTGSTPHGWTALHVLCSGSDASMSKAAIIRHILETRLVSIQAFDRWTNNQVACFFCFGPHIPQGVGFHPPQGYEPQCICLHTSPPTLNSKGVYWHKYDMILQVE